MQLFLAHVYYCYPMENILISPEVSHPNEADVMYWAQIQLSNLLRLRLIDRDELVSRLQSLRE